MNTAEVAIEHVIAGLLAICAFILPFIPEMHDFKIDTKEVVGVLGLAYLVGIVFDRVADTFLSSFETYRRLGLARRRIESKEAPAGDPFPQDKQEFILRQANDGRVVWMNSLRSRIRTARGLAVLGLPAMLGVMTYFADCRPVGWWFVAINAVVAVIAVLVNKAADPDDEFRSKNYFTKEMREIVGDKEKCMSRARKWTIGQLTPFFVLWGASLSGTLVVAAQNTKSIPWGFGAAAVATLMAVLAFWTWQRINKTYLGFVSRTDVNEKVKT